MNKRKVRTFVRNPTSLTWNGSAFTSYDSETVIWYDERVAIASVNHKRTAIGRPRKGKPRKFRYNEGSDFVLERDTTILVPYEVSYDARPPYQVGFRYSGPNSNTVVGTTHCTGATLDSVDAFHYGTKAFVNAKRRLVAPDFDGVTELLEFKDVPKMLKSAAEDILFMINSPHLWTEEVRTFAKQYAKHPRALGEFHLAVQFGWLPFMRMANQFIDAFDSTNKRIPQLLKDNGKSVRRRGTLAKASASFTEAIPNVGMTMVANSSSIEFEGPYHKTTTVTSRAWYSGRFKYWLPDLDYSFADSKQNLRSRLFGLTFSPSQLYNAMPWSWLIDYFTPLGDLVEGLLDTGVADRFAADYCFVMKHDRMVTDVTHNYKIVGSPALTMSSSRVTERKVRRVGTPFGFGATTPLSSFQLSIMGALGLSKLR